MRSSACYINTGIHTSLLHWRCILELKEKTTFCVLWSALIKRSKDVRPPNPNLKIRNMVTTSTLPTSVLTTDISNGRKDARMDTIITLTQQRSSSLSFLQAHTRTFQIGQLSHQLHSWSRWYGAHYGSLLNTSHLEALGLEVSKISHWVQLI